MQDVMLIWKGTEYRVEARDVLPMIAKIEEYVTFFELNKWRDPEKVSLAKLAMAYGTALRHAGARVTNDEVFEGMFDSKGSERIAQSIQSLLMMMVPPEHLQEKDIKKKAEEPPADNLSKRRTRRQSHGDSAPENSGK